MQPRHDQYDIYVGSYADAAAPGVYHMRLNVGGGRPQLTIVSAASGIVNPSYVEWDRQRHVLFAVSEVDEGQVAAYSIAADGGLTQMAQVSTQGASPCYIGQGRSRRFIVCANYTGGNVCLLPISADGRLQEAVDVIQHAGRSVHPERQTAPHPHASLLDPTQCYLFVPDLGMDKIVVYAVAEDPLALRPHREFQLPAGAGPRHLAFHPNGRMAYLMNELNSTVVVFAYDAKAGDLHALQTVSTLPLDFRGENMAADIHLSPDGRFLYGSNRGHDSIVVFAVDATGRLTLAQHQGTEGNFPRHFGLTSDGAYLLVANQESNDITVFRVARDGRLRFTGARAAVSRPTCIQFG